MPLIAPVLGRHRGRRVRNDCRGFRGFLASWQPLNSILHGFGSCIGVEVADMGGWERPGGRKCEVSCRKSALGKDRFDRHERSPRRSAVRYASLQAAVSGTPAALELDRDEDHVAVAAGGTRDPERELLEAE